MHNRPTHPSDATNRGADATPISGTAALDANTAEPHPAITAGSAPKATSRRSRIADLASRAGRVLLEALATEQWTPWHAERGMFPTEQTVDRAAGGGRQARASTDETTIDPSAGASSTPHDYMRPRVSEARSTREYRSLLKG